MDANKLTLNAKKTKYLLFDKSNRSENKFKIMINGTEIEQVKEIRYLGVYLDNKLSWKRHIDYIVTKLSSATGVIYKLKDYVPMKQLISVYHSIVGSHLQYGIVNWGNAAAIHLNKLLVAQNRTIRAITNRNKIKTKLLPLYDKLGLLRIDSLYKLEVTKFMYKFLNNNLPEPFSDYYHKVSSVHSLNTRRSASNSFYLPRFKRKGTQNSIKYTGIKIWEELPTEIKLKINDVKPKTFFNICKEQLLVTQAKS